MKTTYNAGKLDRLKARVNHFQEWLKIGHDRLETLERGIQGTRSLGLDDAADLAVANRERLLALIEWTEGEQALAQEELDILVEGWTTR